MYLYRAIDSVGDTVEFFFSKSRDLPAAKRFFKRALERHGRPDCVVIDGSQTNREAIRSCDATNRLKAGEDSGTKSIRIRSSKYLNNRIEQDHRRIKRRVRSMLGFKSEATAAIILVGIEMIHMMRKRQARYAYNPSPSIAEQFTILAARQSDIRSVHCTHRENLRRNRLNTQASVRAVSMARSEYRRWPPRILRRGACHPANASGVNHSVRLPRRRRPASYSRQFVTLNFIFAM
jgi:hypothetical protein